jgi:hypothetical protein
MYGVKNEPVEDDVDFAGAWGRCGFLYHQEPLSVRANIPVEAEFRKNSCLEKPRRARLP